MTLAEMPSPMSQTCRLAKSRKPNTKVRMNSSFGSSPSKPSPVIMLFVAWNTRLPSSSAQPAAMMMEMISSVTGATRRK